MGNAALRIKAETADRRKVFIVVQIYPIEVDQNIIEGAMTVHYPN